MTYSLVVQKAAKADALNYAAYIVEESRSTEAASKWLRGLDDIVATLAEQPSRFRRIPEQDSFAMEVRQVLFHSHRVIYHVEEASKTVHILRVYHGSKRPLKRGDLG